MKKVTLMSVVFLIAQGIYAQEITEKQVTAFEESYKSEAQKDYVNAASILKEPWTYNEKSYEINLRLGWLNYMKGDYANSQVYYKIALSINPKSIEALLGLVYPLSAIENWNALFENYQKILSIDPSHAQTNYRIALMYYYKKDYTNTEKHLKKVLENYPFDYDCLLLLAQTKQTEGKNSEAKGYYLRAKLYSPSSADVKKGLEKL